MNGEHYMFYGSQLTWLRSCSIPATVTPIFPSVAMTLHVLWCFPRHVNQTHNLCTTLCTVYQIILLQNILRLTL